MTSLGKSHQIALTGSKSFFENISYKHDHVSLFIKIANIIPFLCALWFVYTCIKSLALTSKNRFTFSTLEDGFDHEKDHENDKIFEVQYITVK